MIDGLFMRTLMLTLCLGAAMHVGYAQGQTTVSSKGREFWVGFMQNFLPNSSPAESITIIISADEATSGTIEIPGQGWSQNFTVAANGTTPVVIPNAIGEHNSSGIIESKGIYIATEDTVAVFALNFEPSSADAARILAIESLGSEYRVMAHNAVEAANWSRSQLLVVAAEDDTEVEIVPTADCLPAYAAGVPFTVNLNRGESFQLRTQEATTDLTGSLVHATPASGVCRPFAVFSGNDCARVPVNCTACDHIYEQNLPVTAWGSDFIAVPFTMTAQYTVRILAHENATQVTINGAAQGVLNAGQFMTLNGQTSTLCISTDKPSCVAQFMEGVNCAIIGDPVMMLLNANDQRIDEITFSTVSSPVLATHGLNLVMLAASAASVLLDGAALDPAWLLPVAQCPDFVFASIAIAEGAHSLVAPDGVNAYVYGVGNAESYGYCVGSAFAPPPPDQTVCNAPGTTVNVSTDVVDPVWYLHDDPSVILATGTSFVFADEPLFGILVAEGMSLQSGCLVTEEFLIQHVDPVEVALSSSAATVCSGQSVTLTAIPAVAGSYTYTWSPAAAISGSGASVVVSLAQTTAVSVVLSTTEGCVLGEAVLNLPVLQTGVTGFSALTSSDSLCFGDEVQLEAQLESVVFDDNFDPGVSWGLWSLITNGAASQACGSVNGNALYFNGNGQRQATTVAIDAEEGGTVRFHLKLGSETAPCDQVNAGEEVVLEYATAGAAGPYVVIQTFDPGMYDEFTLTNVPIPPGAQTAATHFRFRQVAHSGNGQDNWALDNVQIGVLNVANPVVSWSPAGEVEDPTALMTTAQPTSDTWYTVSLTTNQGNCTYLDSVFVAVAEPIVFTLTADTLLCTPSELTLEAVAQGNAAYTYLWSGPGNAASTGSSIDVNLSGTSVYHLTLQLGNCSASDSVTVTVSNVTGVVLNAADNAICEGETTTLEASVQANGNYDFSWLTPAALPDELVLEVTPAQTTLYAIQVSDVLTGCTHTDSLEVQVSPSFSVDAGPDLGLCQVESWQLNAVSNAVQTLTWSWSNPTVLSDAGVPDPFILENGNHDFVVTATDNVGCTASDSVSISFVFLDFGLGPDVDACANDTVELSSGLSAQWQHVWSDGSSGTSINATTEGWYSVTVASPDGCVVSDSLYVTFVALPQVSIGVEGVLCVGETVLLHPGAAGESYLWSTGATSQSIQVTASGTYEVTVTTGPGCAATDATELSFAPLPAVPLEPVSAICEEEVGTLDAGDDGVLYEWSTGENSPAIAVDQPGMYEVTVTGASGCTSVVSTEVVFAEYPEVDLGPDAMVCAGTPFVLDAGNPGEQHVWSTGASGQLLEVTTSGQYSVMVDNGFCQTTEAINVTVVASPVTPGFDVAMLCEGEEEVLSAGNSGFFYEWSTGSTAQEITIKWPGTYWVRITTPLGCQNTFYHHVEAGCDGYTLFIPSAFTPGTDHVNDVFRAYGTNIVEFSMTIWDRWGTKIAELDGLHDAWDGSYRGGNHYVNNGVYVYRAVYRSLNSETNRVSDQKVTDGTITVIR